MAVVLNSEENSYFSSGPLRRSHSQPKFVAQPSYSKSPSRSQSHSAFNTRTSPPIQLLLPRYPPQEPYTPTPQLRRFHRLPPAASRSTRVARTKTRRIKSYFLPTTTLVITDKLKTWSRHQALVRVTPTPFHQPQTALRRMYPDPSLRIDLNTQKTIPLLETNLPGM